MCQCALPRNGEKASIPIYTFLKIAYKRPFNHLIGSKKQSPLQPLPRSFIAFSISDMKTNQKHLFTVQLISVLLQEFVILLQFFSLNKFFFLVSKDQHVHPLCWYAYICKREGEGKIQRQAPHRQIADIHVKYISVLV